jgi:hypothetical protein
MSQWDERCLRCLNVFLMCSNVNIKSENIRKYFSYEYGKWRLRGWRCEMVFHYWWVEKP